MSKQEISQKNNEFILTKDEMKEEVIAHYDFLIGRCIKRYQNRTMGELWKALDKLKAKMEQELNEIEQHYLDIQDAESDAR